jgi:hypothetical protein
MTTATMGLGGALRRPRLGWVVWRQHRTQLLSGAAVLAVVGLFLLWTHHSLTTYVSSSGLAACEASGESCDQLEMQVSDHYRSLLSTVGFFNFFPLLVGMFWGAPLVARELEQGTHRLAWTQTVTRRRWFLSRVVALAVAATLAAWLFGWMVSSWFLAFHSHEPDGASRIGDEVYNFSGLAPIGYTLYAFALAVVLGAVFRRTLVAMGATLVLWLPIRIWFESVRGHLIAPLKISFAPFSGYPRAGRGDWVIEQSMVGPNGAPLGFVRAGEGPCGLVVGPGKIGGKGDIGQCLADHGFHQVATYQPASRFWELQSIEFAVFGGAALALLVVAYLWVTRKATA